MNILHIANYYTGPKVFKNLVDALDKLDARQTVYTAFINNQLTGANAPLNQHNNTSIVYSPILTFYSRLNFFHKQKKVTEDIEKKVSIQEFSVIHAHTLYSDGCPAYNLFKKYGTPYIVTIRNTDINLFFKYLLHLRPKAKKVLLNAKKIIFISEAYRKRLINHSYFKDVKATLEEKSVLLPNGVADFWRENTFQQKTLGAEPRLLFVGKYNKGKNIINLIDAIAEINKTGNKCVLTLVGSGAGSYYEKIGAKAEQNKIFVKNIGKINDPNKLLEVYRNHDVFVMPSFNETFGLVYVEALSQGLPIVYTKNEGVDGFFPPEAGEAVDPRSIESIKESIEKIIDNYTDYTFTPKDIISVFNWNTIAEKYIKLYKR